MSATAEDSDGGPRSTDPTDLGEDVPSGSALPRLPLGALRKQSSPVDVSEQPWASAAFPPAVSEAALSPRAAAAPEASAVPVERSPERARSVRLVLVNSLLM